MLSRNPLEPAQRVEGERVAEAVRLAAIAELDAINLYLQLASGVSDESVRKVLLDVANEERTHFGEFLSLLTRLDPAQAKELASGAEEVKALTGGTGKETPGDPQLGPLSGDEAEQLRKAVDEALSRSRHLRQALPLVRLGDGAIAVLSESITEGDVVKASQGALQLQRLSVQFSVEQGLIDYAKRMALPLRPSSAVRAASLLAEEEDSAIALGLESSAKTRVEGDWSAPGSFTGLVSRAIEGMSVKERLSLIISPSTRAYLASVVDQSGLDELSRVSRVVEAVVVSPGVKDDEALLVSAVEDVVDVAVGSDGRIDYVGLQGSAHVFELWETLALRVKLPGGIAIIARAKK